MSNAMMERTVGSLVTENPGRARVFERLGIDYCCGGKRPLSEACAAAGVSGDEVLSALEEAAGQRADAEEDWSTAPLTALIENIVATHHAYLRVELPRLSAMADKVAEAHGGRHPEVATSREVLAELRRELELHMLKEEQILFPMIATLEAADAPPAFHCGSLLNPIGVMEHEHARAGQGLATLRSLTSDYTAPDDACNTYRAWLDGLRELEADLHRHIHKENEILFPRAMELEAARGHA